MQTQSWVPVSKAGNVLNLKQMTILEQQQQPKMPENIKNMIYI